MQNRIIWGLVLSFLLFTLFYSFSQGLKLNKLRPSDLRNRVVGARLIKDGIGPYFYKWEKGDSIRYYDPMAFNGLKVTNITASPFLLRLIYPIVEWPQSTISIVWLYGQYAIVLLSMFLAIYHAKNKLQYWMVMVVGGLFILTQAWYTHLFAGQFYILVPLLAILFFFVINKSPTYLNATIAGTIAITLVLSRPNSLVFLIPFSWYILRFSMQYLMAFFLPVLAGIVLICSSSFERRLWVEFKEAVGENIALHQGLNPTPIPAVPRPLINEWEGINESEASKYEKLDEVKLYSENGNVFVIFKHLFGHKPNYKLLFISSIIVIISISCLFYYKKQRKSEVSLFQMAMLGYFFYMVTDLCSPIYRHQYYTVQWLFPVLLAAAFLNKQQKWLFITVVIALLLNIGRLPYIKMEHTIGEYMILGTLLFYSFGRQPTHQQ